jgi:PAS domain S-box-containing protein
VATWNAGAERLEGYRAEEILGHSFARFYPPEDLANGKPARELAAAAVDGRFEDEGWRVRKDGSRFWANVVITAVRDGAGRLRGFGKVTRDFSDRHRAEEERANASRFLDSVLESIPAMIFVKDAHDLRFVRMNKAGEELLGIERAELIGKSDHDLFPQNEADFFVHKDREVLQKGELVTIAEEPLQTRHGQRYVHTKKIPILDEDGRPRYLLGISLDITDARLARQKLQQAHGELETLNRRLAEQNEELVRANRAKSDLLAMMSRELRTPLGSIIGFSQVLLDQKLVLLDERQTRDLRNVNDSGRQLLGVIDNLIDLSTR